MTTLITKHRMQALTGAAALTLTLLLPACGGGGGGGGGAPPVSPISLGQVIPLYPNNGADWNDYVKNDGASRYEATDTACAGTETGGYAVCLHSGEKRAVPVTGLPSCAGLTATDALGAFDWVCHNTGGSLRMISRGLKDGGYLSDLIDFTSDAWNENSVTVYKDGNAIGSTASTVWWSNPIVVDNDGGSLDATGTIYLVKANPSANYIIGAVDKVGFVIQPGITARGDGGGSGISVLRSFSFTTPQKFLWIEGKINAVGNYGIELGSIYFSVFRGFSSINAEIVGFTLSDSYNNLLHDLRVSSAKSEGFSLQNSSYNMLRDVWAVNNGGSGFRLVNSSKNLLINVNAANNIVAGIEDNGSSNNVLVNLTASNNRSVLTGGVYLTVAQKDVLINLLSSNNGGDGIQFNGAPGHTLLNGAVVNNARYGVHFEQGGSTDNTLINLSVAHNLIGIHIIDPSATGNHFRGLLKVGNSTDCRAPTTQGNGLMTATGSGPCLIDTSLSDATLIAGVSAAASFVGKVTSDDASNTSDASGSMPFETITDWTTFANLYRAWGKDGGIFPAASQQGRCGTTGETCRIWDWSLADGDTGDDGSPVLLNALALPTGNDTLTHTWDAADAAACTAISGALWEAGASRCTSTFLRHAVEILNDDVGNDNLLCESGETCLYTPNIGSYQGHGTLVSAGAFADGMLTGIALLKHENNGY